MCLHIVVTHIQRNWDDCSPTCLNPKVCANSSHWPCTCLNDLWLQHSFGHLTLIISLNWVHPNLTPGPNLIPDSPPKPINSSDRQVQHENDLVHLQYVLLHLHGYQSLTFLTDATLHLCFACLHFANVCTILTCIYSSIHLAGYCKGQTSEQKHILGAQ